ncbi:MAG: double-strand break repair helicase AddA [Kordiimonadaceae bacterium]|jgi:ATP-dependent helicase/nuclease subunit A|nr:double-strand break repair helicase AddA [Kordiimonadaceae bacterium]MBT6031152.1 double-strand break repair helicase AddA [Kordiimonadaceae bacterium]
MAKQTLEQLKASDPSSSVWVGASAGTGKTYVLTNRVLRLMLSGTRPDKILCLTYTNNAAAEMAIRVNGRLASWVAFNDDGLRNELSNLLGTAPSDDQCVLARKLFAQVLDVAGGLKIQTIHSFCQSLLGRFPIEAQVTPNFSLLDDITINEHLRCSQDELLLNIQNGGQGDLRKALDYLASMLAESTFADLMKNLANERGGLEYLKQINSSSFEKVILSLKDLLGLIETDSRQNILKVACEENNFDKSGLLRAANELLQTSSSFAKNGEKIKKWIADEDDRFEGYNEYKLAFLTKKNAVKSDKKLASKKTIDDHPDLYEILHAEANRILEIEEKLAVLKLFEDCEAALRMGYALIKIYSKRKISHNVVDFDDLILKVRRLFEKPNFASWILYKLDGGLDHILIDEAQDTNPDHWYVIRVLVSEFFAGLGTRDEEDQLMLPRTIFAVGDIKQSIYSFQKAEPKQFNTNKEYFEDQAKKAELKFSNIPMNMSFRSTSAVLEVVDEVFKAQEDRIAISFTSDPIKHDTYRKGEAGLVEIWDTEKPEVIIEQEDNWSPPIIQRAEDDPRRKIAERIADQIQSWIKNADVLTSKGRPISAGDILILVQRRKEFFHYMVRALKNRNIDVAGLDRMKLTEQLAVMDLMAVANLTLLPSDDLTLAVVLKSPFINMSEEDLFDLSHPRGKKISLWATLLSRRNEREIFSRAANYLTELTNYADFAPPFEFFSYLLGPQKGREKLLARLGEQVNDPIDEFLNQAMKFEQNNISSMQGFLNWIESGAIEIKRDMEQSGDMVRIMTTHGAKGLQAPIVFLPDTCQISPMQDKLHWYKEKHELSLLWVKNEKTRIKAGEIAYSKRLKALEDEKKRLLYVAMTRAEDRLYVTGWETKDNKDRSEDCWYDMIRNAVSEMEGTEEIENGDEIILRREQPQTIEVKVVKVVKSEIVPLSKLPHWANEMPMSEPVPTKPLTPSRPEEEEEAVTSPLLAFKAKKIDQQKYHRGRIIHKLLEILPDIDASQRIETAYKYLCQAALQLSESNVQEISEEVLDILNDSDFEPLFGPASRSEVPIVGQIGSFSLSGIVDRLVVLENEILIVDYKTNRPPPSGASNIPKIYQRQMAAYKAVLGDIYPEHKIRSFLLWTDICTLMEIPDEMLNKITF